MMRILCTALAGLFLCAAAAAQQADPFDGVWVLNVGKSTMTGPAASSSEILTMRIIGNEEHFNTHAVQARDNAQEHSAYKAAYGGPAAPLVAIYVDPMDGSVSRIDAEMVRVRRIDARTTEREVIVDGKVRMHARRVLSDDGKTMHASILGKDDNGREVILQTRVFEKK